MKKYTEVYEKCLERITTNYKWEQSVTFIDLGGSGKLEGYLGNRSLDLSYQVALNAVGALKNIQLFKFTRQLLCPCTCISISICFNFRLLHIWYCPVGVSNISSKLSHGLQYRQYFDDIENKILFYLWLLFADKMLIKWQTFAIFHDRLLNLKCEYFAKR